MSLSIVCSEESIVLDVIIAFPRFTEPPPVIEEILQQKAAAFLLNQKQEHNTTQRTIDEVVTGVDDVCEVLLDIVKVC